MNLELVQAARLVNFNPAEGWPGTLVPWQIGYLQGETKEDKNDIATLLELDISAGNVEHTQIDVVAKYLGEGLKPRICSFVTAAAVAQWMKKHRITPSRHIAAWIEATAPEPARSLPNTEASSNQSWTLRKPKRMQGYSEPLYRLLRDAHETGKPKPTAHDVLQALFENPPSQIAKSIPGDSLDYYTADGKTKTANLQAITEAIARLTR